MRNPNFPETSGNGHGSGPIKELSTSFAAPAATEATGFLADIEDLITATTSLTGEDLARAKAQLLERVASAKTAVAKMSSAVSESARQGARATDNFVQERPWQAVGIAAVVGVLAGLVLARRK